MVSNFINGVLKRAKSAKLDLADANDSDAATVDVPEQTKTNSQKLNQETSESQRFAPNQQNPAQVIQPKNQEVDNNIEPVGQTTQQQNIQSEEVLSSELTKNDQLKETKINTAKTPKKETKTPKVKKSKKPFFSNFSLKSVKSWMIIAIVNFLLFVLTLGFFLLGFDEKIFKSSLEGVILDSQNSSISAAQVTFQEQEVISDANGKFVIDDIERGSFSIKIEAQNYKTLEIEVKIDKLGVNNKEFVLDSQKYTNLNGQLKFDAEEIDPASFVLKIDNEIVNVDSNGEFKVDNVEIKKVNILLTSQVYKDISIDYELSAGQQNVINTLSLIPAKDFNLVTRDWLTGEIIANVAVSYDGVELTSDEAGVAPLKDIEIAESTLILAEKEGYQLFNEEMLFDGEEKALLMVPQQEILYTKTNDSQSLLYKSALDGSNSELILENQGNILQTRELENEIVFVSDKDKEDDTDNNQIYSYSKETEEVTKLSDIDSGSNDAEGRKITRIFDFPHRRIISYHKHETDQTQKVYLEVANFDGENNQVLYNSRPASGIKRIVKTPVLSQDGNQAAFVVSDYSVSTDKHVQSVAYIITDLNDRGSIRSMYTTTSSSANVKILGVPEGNKLSVIIDDQDGEDVILLIDLQTRNIQKKVLNFTVSNNSENLIGDELYILSDGSTGGDLYKFNIQTLELTKLTDNGTITGYVIDEYKNLIFYKSGENLLISSLQSPQFIRETSIETNFNMW